MVYLRVRVWVRDISKQLLYLTDHVLLVFESMQIVISDKIKYTYDTCSVLRLRYVEFSLFRWNWQASVLGLIPNAARPWSNTCICSNDTLNAKRRQKMYGGSNEPRRQLLSNRNMGNACARYLSPRQLWSFCTHASKWQHNICRKTLHIPDRRLVGSCRSLDGHLSRPNACTRRYRQSGIRRHACVDL